MPLLRGHHLVCLHFFDGEGYDDAFIKNLEDTLRRAEDEDVEIASGVDDICACCLHFKHNRCEQVENADEDVREMDAKALALLGLSIPGRIKWNVLWDKVPGIFPQWYALYCTDCDWRGTCEKNDSFRELLKEG